jgi:hypothetical protein
MELSASNAHPVGTKKTFAAGYVFGAPVHELGIFASLIMGLAVGFMGFFAATFVGIVVVMISSGHPADYTISYRLIGLPVGLLLGVVSLGYLGTFWVKRILRKT